MSRDSALAVAIPSPVPINTSPVGEEGSSTPQKTLTEAPPAHNLVSPHTPPEVPQSKSFSILAKREAEILRQKEELKLEREKVTPILQSYQQFDELRKKDPIAAIKMLGFSETELFNYLAQQTPVELTPEQKAVQAAEAAATAKIKAFEDAQTKREADIQQKAHESVIQSFKGSVSQVIQAAPEKFEYCNYYGAAAEDLIFATVEAVIQRSQGQEVPTAEEAAQMVEEFYEEQDKAMSQLKKRNPPKPAVEEPPAAQESDPTRTRTLAADAHHPGSKPPTRTLSSGTTVTAASARAVTRETLDQKRERLIEKLRNGG